MSDVKMLSEAMIMLHEKGWFGRADINSSLITGIVLDLYDEGFMKSEE